MFEWLMTYCHWWTSGWWRCTEQAHPRHRLSSSSASPQSSPSECHPLIFRTAAPPLCAEDGEASEVPPAAQGHGGFPEKLPWAAARCICSFGSNWSCTRGADRPVRPNTARWTFCVIFWRISRCSANTLPTPEPRQCTESAARVLRGIRTLLRNRMYQTVVSVYMHAIHRTSIYVIQRDFNGRYDHWFLSNVMLQNQSRTCDQLKRYTNDTTLVILCVSFHITAGSVWYGNAPPCTSCAGRAVEFQGDRGWGMNGRRVWIFQLRANAELCKHRTVSTLVRVIWFDSLQC